MGKVKYEMRATWRADEEVIVMVVHLVFPQLDSAQLRLEESRLRLNSDPLSLQIEATSFWLPRRRVP